MSGDKKKRSLIWKYFNDENDKAKCDLCGICISHRGGSTGNLLRHLKNKHCGIQLFEEEKEVRAQNRESGATITSQDDPPPTTVNVAKAGTSTAKQTKITHFSTRPLPVNKSKKIDEQLVRMIAKEYHPFSLVEDPEFVKYSSMLNPNYSLPSRKTLSNTLLPQYYEMEKRRVKEDLRHHSVKAVSVTVDGWTSLKNESFLAMTVHFINEDFELKSYLLDCFKYSDRHTSENLAAEMKRVLTEWELLEKVEVVISDNAANITKAIRLCGWNHIPCFAHSLNLMVQAGMDAIKDTQAKVKSIVEYFKRSSHAAERLRQMQKQMECPEVVLKQDVVTRWNSTYEMFSRVLQVKEPLVSTLALLNPQLLTLSEHDWKVLQGACDILRYFQDITVELSSEKTVTISKVIVLCNMLRRKFNKIKASLDLPEEVISMTNKIMEVFTKRCSNIEENKILAIPTLLDPRFKRQGFSDGNSFEKAKSAVLRLISITNEEISNPISVDTISADEAPEQGSSNDNSLWREFDEQVFQLIGRNDPTVAGIVEVDKFLHEPLLKRTENPLVWWKTREALYPRLSRVILKKFCVIATSVPCERIFSKGGQVVTERRNRLTAEKVSKLLFLNFNWK